MKFKDPRELIEFVAENPTKAKLPPPDGVNVGEAVIALCRVVQDLLSAAADEDAE